MSYEGRKTDSPDGQNRTAGLLLRLSPRERQWVEWARDAADPEAELAAWVRDTLLTEVKRILK